MLHTPLPPPPHPLHVKKKTCSSKRITYQMYRGESDHPSSLTVVHGPQLCRPEDPPAGSLLCGAVGAGHLLLDKWPLRMQLLAEARLLLPARDLVRIRIIITIIIIMPFSRLSQHSKTPYIYTDSIFQAHTDSGGCGLCQHSGSLPGCHLRNSLLSARTPVLALQQMGGGLALHRPERQCQDT